MLGIVTDGYWCHGSTGTVVAQIPPILPEPPNPEDLVPSIVAADRQCDED